MTPRFFIAAIAAVSAPLAVGAQPPAPVGARAAQVRTIPDVVGMPVARAVDSLTWTKLKIVPLDSVTSRVARGIVVHQSPRAGTPIYAARAETLYVAVPPPRRDDRGFWSELIGAIATAVGQPERPPVSSQNPDVPPAPAPIPEESVAATPSTDPSPERPEVPVEGQAPPAAGPIVSPETPPGPAPTVVDTPQRSATPARPGLTPDTLAIVNLSAVPNFIGMRRTQAQTAAELAGLRIVITSTVRQLRVRDAVTNQDPRPFAPRRRDNIVDVSIAIPIVPPLAALIAVLALVAGIAGVRIMKRPPPTPAAPEIALHPVSYEAPETRLEANGRKSLVSAAFTLRFGNESSAPTLQTRSPSLVKQRMSTNG